MATDQSPSDDSSVELLMAIIVVVAFLVTAGSIAVALMLL